MDLLGIALEQLGFVIAILFLLYLISIVTRRHVSSDVEVSMPPAFTNMVGHRKKISQS
jgi:hypothetical protein